MATINKHIIKIQNECMNLYIYINLYRAHGYLDNFTSLGNFFRGSLAEKHIYLHLTENNEGR